MWLFRCRESWAVFRGVLSAVQLRSAEHGKVQGTASAGHGKCRAFAPAARVPFVLAKGTKTAVADAIR
ncbi:hypothetical protein VDF98_21805, partial [Xanthomonas campestris pv. raphani]|uniref:hypothetical protein n=1 Tax=Xanthomonas campestris TaxID=339 RepID=UPI002B22541E